MHVVVVGCGRVGSELATALEGAGHTVAVVDRNAKAFRRLDGFGGQRIVGFGFDEDTLREAGIEQAGALAAVTSGDNTNILCARLAREAFELERVVARIYDPRRAVIYQKLGIPTVATVAWTTTQVLRRILPHEQQAAWVDATGTVSLLERPVPPAWAGRTVAGVEDAGRWSVAAVGRADRAVLARPDLVLQDGDVLHLVVAADGLDDLSARLGGTSGAAR